MANRQNHMTKAEQNKLDKAATSLLCESFPDVSGITIQMTYYHKGVNPVLMLRTVNMFPSNHAYFNMDCVIKDCVDGGFDLTSVIAGMIKNRKKAGKGNLVCNGKVDARAVDHSSIDYDVAIQYSKKSK